MFSLFLQQIAAKMKGILLLNATEQDDIVNQDPENDNDLHFHQQQKSLQQNLQFEQSVLKEREQRVRQIEDDVLDVNQIMRELGALINQQGEHIGAYNIDCFIEILVREFRMTKNSSAEYENLFLCINIYIRMNE